METKLQLVPEWHDDNTHDDTQAATTDSLTFVVPPGGRHSRRRQLNRWRRAERGRRDEPRQSAWARFAAEEKGAVTAEYAIVIMAAVAFAGLLVAILRSDEIRAMLVQLVENALGAAG